MLNKILKLIEGTREFLCFLTVAIAMLVVFEHKYDLTLVDPIAWILYLMGTISIWSFMLSRYIRGIYRNVDYISCKKIGLFLSLTGVLQNFFFLCIVIEIFKGDPYEMTVCKEGSLLEIMLISTMCVQLFHMLCTNLIYKKHWFRKY